MIISHQRRSSSQLFIVRTLTRRCLQLSPGYQIGGGVYYLVALGRPLLQPAIAEVCRDLVRLVGPERDEGALVLPAEVVVRRARLQAVVEGIHYDGGEVRAVVVHATRGRKDPGFGAQRDHHVVREARAVELYYPGRDDYGPRRRRHRGGWPCRGGGLRLRRHHDRYLGGSGSVASASAAFCILDGQRAADTASNCRGDDNDDKREGKEEGRSSYAADEPLWRSERRWCRM